MEERRALPAALAVMGAVAGTGFASGREFVLFFAQTGRLCWLGIALASALFGLSMGLICRLAGRFGADRLSVLSRMAMGRRTRAIARGLYGLLMALTAAAMLFGAGQIGALTLPLRDGRLWGMGLALLIALMLNLTRLRALRWLGLAALLAGVSFYGALALDARPPRIWVRGAVRLALEGSLSASAALALTYAAMNACLAAGVAARFGGAKPGRVGLLCAGMLLMPLACLNAAIARGGRQLLGQALPTVLLSARWGIVGFWACALFGFLCDVASLSAALAGLIDLRARRGGVGRSEGPQKAPVTAYKG